MKILLLTIALISSIICYGQQPPADFKQLLQLTNGSWQMRTAKGITGETWKKINNSYLQSQGFKINLNGDTSLLEKVKLVKNKDGIYYVSQVPNENKGEEVPFKLTENTNNRFIFINPKHDFPQRIGYEFVTIDSLHAWIDGQYNDKFIKQDFYYKRVK